ncbi:ATPase [Bacillus wiedmannii]|uniref:ATPase n=1 Tax=Bacillus wiedmannii TaxID=1890302 RepID=A0A2B6HKU4_9BACI|nr:MULTISPECIES: ATPase [Bacillus]MDI6505271.1 ATPase [Bacillus wiedmannii]MDI6511106.1 ATPase [Bacillus wiedmannii]PGC19545.1 ATPase [Bacillus wiedmannii]PGD34851.1 ATPase [Bacillus wiedmannii]HDR7655932.1 ATPase [Bacillus wiedmannii]
MNDTKKLFIGATFGLFLGDIVVHIMNPAIPILPLVVSNVLAIVFLIVYSYYKKRKYKKEELPDIDERVVNKMKSYFTICITSFIFLFIMYLCVNKYLDRQAVHVNDLLYIAIFGLLISMASTSVLATRNR